MKALLDGLDAGQLQLWPQLSQTPPEFVLYGGVSLTLRFCHRHSADFDFFSSQTFEPHELYSAIPYLQGATVLQLSAGTLTCLVPRATPVRISFFGLPTLGRVGEPEVEEETGLRLASLLDVAATKASVVQKRAASRDYLDLDVLLNRGSLELPAVLTAASRVYGPSFNPQITLKALSFFGDGDLPSLPAEVRVRLQAAVRQVDLERLCGP